MFRKSATPTSPITRAWRISLPFVSRNTIVGGPTTAEVVHQALARATEVREIGANEQEISELATHRFLREDGLVHQFAFDAPLGREIDLTGLPCCRAEPITCARSVSFVTTRKSPMVASVRRSRDAEHRQRAGGIDAERSAKTDDHQAGGRKGEPHPEPPFCVARDQNAVCYAALVTWATGLIVMRSW